MIQKIKITFLLLLCAAIFGVSNNIPAQTVGDETVAVSDSKLAAISFPSGARRVKEQNIPAEIKDTFDRLIAAGGDQIRQGGSEVVIWEGNYTKTKGSQMIKNLETTLKTSGWEYEIGAKESDFVLFSLFRVAPERRALVGFFVPSEEAFIFAITEMVRRDAPQTETEKQIDEEQTTSSDNDSYETVKIVKVGSLSAITGEWVSGSSGSMTTTTSGVYLGGSGSRFTYKFSANGAIEFTGIMNTMTGGCRMQIFRTMKGKASFSGDTLTINWQPASFSREDSCSSSQNYKKTLPAETETFKINFETYFDDKQLCLTGTDKMCFSLTK